MNTIRSYRQSRRLIVRLYATKNTKKEQKSESDFMKQSLTMLQKIRHEVDIFR